LVNTIIIQGFKAEICQCHCHSCGPTNRFVPMTSMTKFQKFARIVACDQGFQKSCFSKVSPIIRLYD